MAASRIKEKNLAGDMEIMTDLMNFNNSNTPADPEKNTTKTVVLGEIVQKKDTIIQDDTEQSAKSKRLRKTNKVQVNFELKEETRNSLLEYCEKNDMTLAAAIRKAIRELLERG